MKRIRTGIIGCGKVGQIHADALKHLSDSDFVGVFSRDFEKARAFAEKNGVRAFRTIADQLKKKVPLQKGGFASFWNQLSLEES